jgi:hypothetical protein
MIPQFDAMWSELLKASLRKLYINKAFVMFVQAEEVVVTSVIRQQFGNGHQHIVT